MYVKTLTGKTVTIPTLTQSSTVEELKAVIQDKEGIPPDQQRLIIRGLQAQDHDTLEQYGMYLILTLQQMTVFQSFFKSRQRVDAIL